MLFLYHLSLAYVGLRLVGYLSLPFRIRSTGLPKIRSTGHPQGAPLWPVRLDLRTRYVDEPKPGTPWVSTARGTAFQTMADGQQPGADSGPWLSGRPAQQLSRLYRAGYWALLVLAFSLPFELTQRPLLHTSLITVTNLKIVFYVVVALAAASLTPPFLAFVQDTMARTYDPSNYFYRKRVTLALFAALLGAYAVSSVLSHHHSLGLKWTLDILLGGLVWLAMPLWLSDQPASRSQTTERKVELIGLAIVAGAVIAALIGFLELALGLRFSDSLLWFKAKPTTAGPYLRLSGTFQYANIAALYFELALPFALVGLARALARPGGHHTQKVPGDAPTDGDARLRWISIVAWMLAVDILLRAILLTYSRGAFLGLFGGIAAMVLVLSRGRSPSFTLWRMRIRRQWLRPAGHPGKQGTRLWAVAIAAGLVLTIGSVVFPSNTALMLRLTSQSDQEWYKAAYTSAVPATMAAGRRAIVPVTVENRGPLTWNAAGANPFKLGYHWLFMSKKVARFEGFRTSLPAEVPPGGKLTVPARLLAPCRSGNFLLVWDMVQQDVTWFSLKSATYTAVPVRILPGKNSGAAAGCATAPQGLAPTVLPTTLSEPGRRKLWSTALAMFKAHPLFGVGPDGYRLNYGAYSTPRQRSWDTRILANSLILELLADVGVVGAGLFLAFLAALIWPLIRQVTTWWQVALVGAMAAFLGHGLVDYILGADAIFILFWLLCGLAATASSGYPSGSPAVREGEAC